MGVNRGSCLLTEHSSDETSFELLDVCPDGTVVEVGGNYKVLGEVYSTTILNRNSRYLFVILDTGGDGICCNYGPEGYYEIYMDNVLQAKGGKFESSASEVFGACPGPTSKPTNVVCHLYISNRPLISCSFLTVNFPLSIDRTAHCKPYQQCQF